MRCIIRLETEENLEREIELDPAGTPVTIGRDLTANISLSDPDRFVSRRHVTVRLSEGGVEIRVLAASEVETSLGPVQPGGCACLGDGDFFWLGHYKATIVMVDDEMQHSPAQSVSEAYRYDSFDEAMYARLSDGNSEDAASGDPFASDDPFGDWEDDFLVRPPPLPHDAPAVAEDRHIAGPVAGDTAEATWTSLLRGLGLPTSHPVDARSAELLGATIRAVLQGFTDLSEARIAFEREIGVLPLAELASGEGSQLKARLSTQDLMEHLLGAGSDEPSISSARAVQQTMGELSIHGRAMLSGLRSAIDGLLGEFEPDHLESVLMPQVPKALRMLQERRIWSAFRDYYRRNAIHNDQWYEKILDRYFADTYRQESTRLARLQEHAPPR
jgi:predicted component of type VI protein secretion system